MNPPPTNWLPGLIVLAVGCIAAAFYLFLQRSKASPEPAKGAKGSPAPRTGELEDLDRRYQSLIEQLKELAADKHSVTPERFASERSRLELEAAAALRARDELLKNPATAPTASPAPAPSWLSPQLKGALWGGGIVLFFCTLGYLLVSEQHTRGDQESATGKLPPGMSASADAQAGAQDAQGQQDPDLDQAWERFKSNPSDLEAAAVLSHELIRRQMYEDAERITQRGLALDPFYAELRVHQGVLRAVRGDEAGAEQQLRMLADLYPDAQEGMLFLGALEMRQGDKAKALESFERFAVEVPTNMHPPPLLGAIQQLRSELGRR